MNWYFKVLNQYADFKGRASREEYWMFYLFNLLATFALTAIGLGIMFLTNNQGAILLPCLYLYAVMIPNLAVTFRRLHDTGRSAWFLFVNLIPLVGAIWFLIVLIKKGDTDENMYGKNPTTMKQTVYHRKRSAAVALIFASIFWFLSFALTIVSANSNNYYVFLSLFLPFFLIIIGLWLFSKRKFSTGVANTLIILSIVWLLRFFFTIRNSYSLLIASFNLPLLINLLIITVPIALLLSGIYILRKISDRTVPASLMFVGSIIWILSSVLQILVGGFDIVNLTLPQISVILGIIVPVSLIVFARTLLSKEKSAKEVERIPPVSDPIRKPVVIQPAKKPIEPIPVVRKNMNEKIADQPAPATSEATPATQPEQSVIAEATPTTQPEQSAIAEATLLTQPEQSVPAIAEATPLTKPEQSVPVIVEATSLTQPEQSTPVIAEATPITKPKQPAPVIAEATPVTQPKQPAPPIGKVLPLQKPVKPDPLAFKVLPIEKPRQPIPIRKEKAVGDEMNRKVVFLREDKDNNNIWVVYKAQSKADATAFLSKQTVNRPSFYVVVETPEGNFGKDKDGLYQE